jgi:hypothetical protein
MPITLTATLEDLTGAVVGSSANPAKVCITLCGYGAQLPRIAGTTMIARPGPMYFESVAGTFSAPILGNDAIAPGGTYYTVEILDGQGNIVQTAAYQFTGTGNFDLSNAVPIVPPYGFPTAALVYQPCTLGANNHTFTANGPVIAVAYNGVLMPQGQSAPTLSYTLSGLTITTNFDIDPTWERIDAFCIL